MSTAVHQMRYHHPSAALSAGVQGLRDKQYEKEEEEEKQKERKTVPATGMMTMGYGWPYAALMQQQHQQQYQQYLFMQQQQQQQLQAMMATTGGSPQMHSHHRPNPHHLAK